MPLQFKFGTCLIHIVQWCHGHVIVNGVMSWSCNVFFEISRTNLSFVLQLVERDDLRSVFVQLHLRSGNYLLVCPGAFQILFGLNVLYCFISLQICNTIAKPSQFRLDMKRTRTCVRSLTCQIREQLTSCVLQMFLAWLDLTWLLPWLDLTFAIFHGVQLWTLNIINKGLTITFNTYAFKPYFSSKSAHPPDSYPPGTLILFDSVKVAASDKA